jgi:hypothetical protein
MARRPYLSLWRRKRPSELRGDHGLLDDLGAFLAERVAPQNDDERDLLDALQRRGTGCDAAALALAARYTTRFDSPSDFALTLVLFAALELSDVACLVLAQALDARANAFSGRVADIKQNGTASSAVLKRRAGLCRRIARAWWDEIDCSFLARAQLWSDGFAAIATPPLQRQTMPAAAADAPATAPTRIVVAAIGDIGGSGGEEIAEAYQALTKPLALRGGEADPEQLRTALLAEFPHLGNAVERIIGDLRLRRRAGVAWVRFRPLLLVGPPGVGKTRFAKRLAQLLKLGYGEVSGAGSSDDRMLRGTARGWRDAQPTLLLLVMLRTGGANPLIVVDEVDKAGGSERNGDIRQTLLPMLEIETARAWFDEALLAPADLSGVSWLLTANDLAPISAPLLSRVAVVQAPAPGPEFFDPLLAGILRSIAEELGVDAAALPPLAPEACDRLRQGFIERPDLRRIRRAVESALCVGTSTDEASR